jgi:putative oxidoreductase
MKSLFQIEELWASPSARQALRIVMFPHEAQKRLGLYGGNGFSGTMKFFTEQLGMPALVAFLVIAWEFLESLALFMGFLTRFTSASLALIMVGAITMVHWQHGFFMNCFGHQAGEGYEYHMLAIGLCLSLFMTRGGKYSVDVAIAERLKGSSGSEA